MFSFPTYSCYPKKKKKFLLTHIESSECGIKRVFMGHLMEIHRVYKVGVKFFTHGQAL